MNGFSFGRFLAVLHKEWIQVRRDPMTLRLIIALPVMQLFCSDMRSILTRSIYDRALVAGAFALRAHDRRGPAQYRLLRHPPARFRGGGGAGAGRG
jgi:hypothetical protein